MNSRRFVSRKRRPRWEDVLWVDVAGPQSIALYGTHFRPFVGFNPWVCAAVEGRL